MSERKKVVFTPDGKRDMKANATFCMAPFTHTYISPQSERRLCCASREQAQTFRQYIDKDTQASREEYQPQTLEQHWNSDFLKSVRAKMLRGEKVPECSVCDEQTLNLSTYRAWFTDYLFREDIDRAFQKTSDDGTTELPPVSFDYRVHNSCNFKCRMCGHQLSSAWEAELRQKKSWSPIYDSWMTPENSKKIESFQSKQVETELIQAAEQKQIRELYWVGGEPLIWDIHWKIMDMIVQNRSAKNVYCRYNTNLSRISWKGQHLFQDLLPQVKDYIMCCSLDGIGEIGEWIRTGLKWDQWLSHFKEGLLVPGKRDRMKFDLTLTLPGLLGLKEYFDLAQELDVEILPKLVFAFDPEKVISPLALPKNILHPLLDDLIRYMEPRATSKQFATVALLQNLKTRPTFEEQWPEAKSAMIRGKNWLQKVAEWRGDGDPGKALRLEKILAQKSAVLDWWESLHES